MSLLSDVPQSIAKEESILKLFLFNVNSAKWLFVKHAYFLSMRANVVSTSKRSFKNGNAAQNVLHRQKNMKKELI